MQTTTIDHIARVTIGSTFKIACHLNIFIDFFWSNLRIHELK